jgi:uncharacterized protein YukE
MALVGADLASLDRLRTELAEGASAIDGLKARLESFVTSTEWTGPNADKFQAAYREFQANFPKISAALSDASVAVQRQRESIAAATGAA